MSVRARDIVAEALSWEGTAFGHQQRTKGVMVDCANFVAAVSEATGATPDTDFERNYRKREDGQAMMKEILRYLKPVEHLNERAEVTLEQARLADVIVTHDEKDKTKPRHMAFISQVVSPATRYFKMVHASEHGVVNHIINGHFKSLIHSIWRIPGLEYD